MEFGIFARTFDGQNLDGMLSAVKAHGLRCLQFNLKCAGFENLPETISDQLCQNVRESFDRYGLQMAAISGTYNTIHPDKNLRDKMTSRCAELIRRAPDLGTRVVTLCTGTEDPSDMWRYHPANASSEAWAKLLSTLEELLPVAEKYGVLLGIEPERANVVDSAVRARALLDEMQSNNLRIVFDGANLFEPDDLANMTGVLEQAFELLRSEIEIVHAKDITGDVTKKHQAAGTGALDWSTYFRLMHKSGFEGPVVLHNLLPSQVEASLAFVRKHAACWYQEIG